jgi:hypothetical protein
MKWAKSISYITAILFDLDTFPALWAFNVGNIYFRKNPASWSGLST